MNIYKHWSIWRGLTPVWFNRVDSSDADIPQGDNRTIYLTFDDVPYSQESTTKIVHLLRQHQCKATFFVIGSFLQEAPVSTINLLQEGVAQEYLQLANHGMRDCKHGWLSSQEVENEIVGCGKAAAENKLSLVPLYRPGSGILSKAIMEQSKKHKQQVVLGDVYSLDPAIRFPWFHKYFILHKMRPGSIIILHDRSWTIPLLEELLPALKERGYKTEFLV